MSNTVVLVMPKYSRPVRNSGLGYLAAALHNGEFIARCQPNFTNRQAATVSTAPFDVKVVDMGLAPESFSLGDFLAGIKPQLIGSAALGHNYQDALAIGRLAKEAAPEALRVIGGWEASPRAKEVAGESPFDVVVRNEGEETLVELATLTREVGREGLNGYLQEIEGLTFRAPDGKIGETQTHRPKISLDEYPFPQEGFDLFQFAGYPEENLGTGKVAYITGSRGCIFSCIYCANPAIYTQKIRYRSPENVLAEVRSLYARGYRLFSFRDEIFTANPARSRELVAGLKALQSEGIYIQWFCQTRADLLDETMIRSMQESGLVKIAFGIESGDPAVVNYLKNSRVDLDRCAENQRFMSTNDLVTVDYFIFGGPRQTWQSMFQSHLFVKKAPPTIFEAYELDNLPGNRTAGLPRAVLSTEARLAMVLMNNCFFCQKLSNPNPTVTELLGLLIKYYSNAFRLAVMADLYLRSVGGYSDRERWATFDKMTGVLKTEEQSITYSFLVDFFGLMAMREKGFLPDLEISESNYLQSRPPGEFLVQLFNSVRPLEEVLDLGIHPKVADAYFDEFLSKIKLTNVEHSLLGFSSKSLTRFFLTMSFLWQITRGTETAAPETIELDVDLPENGRKLEALFAGLKLAELARVCNQDQLPEEGLTGLNLNLYGLPISVDGEQKKIIVKASAYQSSDQLSLTLEQNLPAAK